MAYALTFASSTEADCKLPESIKETLLDSFRQLLRPLVRIVLRNGVTYEEFADTAKVVFVEVAKRDLLKKQDKPSPSRIGLLTGLKPQEVERISRVIETRSSISQQNLNQVSGILGAWHQDPLFTGPYGLPLELEFADGPNSFSELVQRYAPDVPPEDMLQELKRIGAVLELAGGALRVTSKAYIPEHSDAASIQFMGLALRDLAETLDANLRDPDGGYFERRVWAADGIDLRDVDAFSALVDTKGMEFLELLDNWVTSKESDAESLPKERKARVGVGVFMFSDSDREFQDD